MPMAGNVSDVKAAPARLERAMRMRYLLGDRGYDADRLRRSLRDAGAVPVIPYRRNRKRAIRYDKDRYCGHPLIENGFCRLKDFRRVATRYDKVAANFLSGVALATTTAFWLRMSRIARTTRWGLLGTQPPIIEKSINQFRWRLRFATMSHGVRPRRDRTCIVQMSSTRPVGPNSIGRMAPPVTKERQ